LSIEPPDEAEGVADGHDDAVLPIARAGVVHGRRPRSAIVSVKPTVASIGSIAVATIVVVGPAIVTTVVVTAIEVTIVGPVVVVASPASGWSATPGGGRSSVVVARVRRHVVAH
jgi:hypothetical protein